MKFIFPFVCLIISLFVFSSCSDAESDEDVKANNFEISGSVKGASGKKIFWLAQILKVNKKK